MVLDDLQRVIENLRNMIETHRAYLSRDETRTRQVLIDPLLRVLGWDVSDPDAVELEYRVEQQRADYVLKSDGRQVALIEAKRLGINLEYDEIMQVLNYANRDGINYIIVTNGDRWEMYQVFRSAALEERLLMKLRLSQQPAHENALQALAMWNPNLASNSGPSEAAEPVFISSESAPDQPSSNANQPPEQVLSNSSPEDSDKWCSFESMYPTGTKPIRLKIDSRIDAPVTHWKDVIHEVVAWLVDENILGVDDCPIGTQKYTFIGCESTNPDGTPLKEPQPLPHGIILQRGYVNFQAQWGKLRQYLNQNVVDKSTIKVFYQMQ